MDTHSFCYTPLVHSLRHLIRLHNHILLASLRPSGTFLYKHRVLLPSCFLEYSGPWQDVQHLTLAQPGALGMQLIRILASLVTLQSLHLLLSRTPVFLYVLFGFKEGCGLYCSRLTGKFRIGFIVLQSMYSYIGSLPLR